MWVLSASREEVINAFQGGGVPLAVEQPALFASDIRKDSHLVQMVWHDKPQPGMLPELIVTSSGGTREFLAWATTYVKPMKPFTGFIRVIDDDLATMLLRLNYSAVPRTVMSVCAALSISEALSHVDTTAKAPRVTIDLCRRTYSFALSRAVHIGFAGRLLSETGKRWFRTRELIGQPVSATQRDILVAPWTAITCLLNRLDGPARLFEAGPLDDPLTRIALAVLQGEQIDPSQWKSVALGYETIELLTGLNSETREQRVVRVEKILDQMLTQLSVRADVRSFVSGFAVSRIAPGTLDHVGLLNETRRVLTGAVLWYGFAAGAVVKNSTTPFSHPLSWRIVRELERRTRVLDRPTADLGLGEFEMLMQRDSLPNDMVFGSMQQLEVELLPAVSTVLTLPDRFRAGEERGGEAEPTKLSKRAVDDVKRLIEIAYRTISGDVLGETGRDKGAQDKRETKGVARKKPRR